MSRSPGARVRRVSHREGFRAGAERVTCGLCVAVAIGCLLATRTALAASGAPAPALFVDPPGWVFGAAAAFGAIVGSFLNVCIVRIPRDESIVAPRSRCVACGRPIRIADNVPLFSYVWLGGRCRSCKTRISPRYLVVEVVTSLLAVGLLLRYGMSWEAPIYFVFGAVLVCISFIDFSHLLIPDVLSLPLIPLGFAASFVLPDVGWQSSGLGILIGGGGVFLLSWLYRLARGIRGLGGGDVKLVAMIGAFVGWQALPVVLFLGSAQGILAAAVLWFGGTGARAAAPWEAEVDRVRKMDTDDSADLPPEGRMAIPFGPFLAAAAIEWIFFGPELVEIAFGVRI